MKTHVIVIKVLDRPRIKDGRLYAVFRGEPDLIDFSGLEIAQRRLDKSPLVAGGIMPLLEDQADLFFVENIHSFSKLRRLNHGKLLYSVSS
jgi:hypothetical protein